MTSRDAKPDLLFLCHRIPFPPNKGDKIRSYRWLRALSQHYRVHLAAFVDDPADWTHRERLEEFCESVYLLALPAVWAKTRSSIGLLTGEALSLPYYRDRRLSRWLQATSQKLDLACVFVYSSVMAQYAVGLEWGGVRRVIDFVDVDSDKWRQYAQRMNGPLRWVYGREARRLELFDKSISRRFNASIFVSRAEADWFRARLDVGGDKVVHVNNGVDTGYFDPDLVFSSPYGSAPAVVFTGAMDYWANVDAVSWFCKDVWPSVLSVTPNAVFYIVGSRPTDTVKALASKQVVVTGRVPDIRPFLRHAAAVAVPVRIARGIQNKVLEGMAMKRPVVVTSKGLEGIPAGDRVEVLVADDAATFSSRLANLLVDRDGGVGTAAREFVRRHFAWEKSTARLLSFVEGRSDYSDAA